MGLPDDAGYCAPSLPRISVQAIFLGGRCSCNGDAGKDGWRRAYVDKFKIYDGRRVNHHVAETHTRLEGVEVSTQTFSDLSRFFRNLRVRALIVEHTEF